MKSNKIKSWSRRNYPWSISPPDKHFLEDIFIQSWAPQKGQAIELGCGTGTISRWLTKKGFNVTGIDISKTAIQMAKTQSKVFKIKYINDDFCSIDIKPLGKYDFCIDGQFLHCITNRQDRKTVLHKIRQLLKPKGVFILMSMCSPINRHSFANLYKNQKILSNIIHIEAEKYGDFQDSRMINKKKYIPMRFVEHWKDLLSELKEVGLLPMLFRYNHCTAKDPTGFLNVAVIRE